MHLRKKSDPDKRKQNNTPDSDRELQESGALQQLVREKVQQYLHSLHKEDPPGLSDLYRMAIDEVESPLLTAVMEYTEGNCSHAARILGLHRSTLYKKLYRHGLLP